MKNNTIFFLILAAILFVGYFLLLGTYPLLDPDETRYVNIARDIEISNLPVKIINKGEKFSVIVSD